MIAEQTGTPPITGNALSAQSKKTSGERRRDDLSGEIRVLIRQRHKLTEEADELAAKCAQLRQRAELEAANRQLRADNELLRAQLASVDPTIERLKKAEQVRVEAFKKRCEALRAANKDFDDCVRAIPSAWTQILVDHPNGPRLMLFLGRSADFRRYLSELKEPVALQRIWQAGCDLFRDDYLRSLGANT